MMRNRATRSVTNGSGSGAMTCGREFNSPTAAAPGPRPMYRPMDVPKDEDGYLGKPG